MEGTEITRPSERMKVKPKKGWRNNRRVRLLILYPQLFLRPLSYLMGSFDRWLDSKSPNWIKSWDTKRYARTTVDRFMYCCRWFAAALILLAVFLGQLFPQNEVLRNEIAPGLLLAAIVIVLLTYAMKRDFSTAEENRSAVERRRDHRSRYGRSSRAMHRLYHVVSFLTCGTFLAVVAEAIDGDKTWRTIALAFCMAVPPLVAVIFSSRLMGSMVSDLEYVKGTTTCREVVVYWLIATVLLILTNADSEEASRVDSALLAAITFVALARICSTGYKEFREAIASGVESAKIEDNAVRKPNNGGDVAASG